MNEVVEVRMSSWKAMVQERNASGYPSKNGAQQTMSVSHSITIASGSCAIQRWLRQARRPWNIPVDSCGFPFACGPSSAVALRIRRADTVIEVSGDAPDNILAFLKAVMTDVV